MPMLKNSRRRESFRRESIARKRESFHRSAQYGALLLPEEVEKLEKRSPCDFLKNNRFYSKKSLSILIVFVSFVLIATLLILFFIPDEFNGEYFNETWDSGKHYTGLDYISLFEQQSYKWFEDTFERSLPQVRDEFAKAGSGTLDCVSATDWDPNVCQQFDDFTYTLLDINRNDFIGSLRQIYNPRFSAKNLLQKTLSLATKPVKHFEKYLNQHYVAQNPGFRITGGSGVGLHIECGEKLLVSFGGGGGGTISQAESGFVSTSGGGGGIQAFDGDLQLLVGGGTGLGISETTPSEDGVANRLQLLEHWPKIKSAVQNCPFDELHFFGAGAGILALQFDQGEENYMHRYYTFGFNYGHNFGRSMAVPENIVQRGVKESYCDYFIKDFQAECWKQNAQHPGQNVGGPTQ